MSKFENSKNCSVTSKFRKKKKSLIVSKRKTTRQIITGTVQCFFLAVSTIVLYFGTFLANNILVMPLAQRQFCL